jgi:two-component system nitrate/nitrite sensor histidine kinase NarX
VTLNTQHDAEAINIAGSMRMQSYQIAVLLQEAATTTATERKKLSGEISREYDLLSKKLYLSSISKTVMNTSQESIQESYENVVASWEHTITPVLSVFSTSTTLDQNQIYKTKNNYLSLVEDHVKKIDLLVLAIQKNTEEKIELLSIYEGMSIFLSFLALVFIVMRTDQNLVKPLKDLVRAAEHTSTGDFSYRAYYEGVNEIGLLCSTFNEMSDNLSSHYQKLEERVNDKTAQLQRSNQILDFLYSTSQRLSEAPINRNKLESILTDLKALIDTPQLALCLTNESGTEKYDLILPQCEQPTCIPDASIDNFLRSVKKHNELSDEELLFSIEDPRVIFGFLYLKTEANSPLEPWHRRVVETVVDHLSSTMALEYKEGLSRRLMLLEERSTIARELHDSLAQSLSYLKIQITRITKLFDKKLPEKDIRDGLDDLQQGINAAYKHLRELLTTFRLKLDAPTLCSALEATADEFNKMNKDIKIVLNYEIDHSPLSANEDIHVLQIVREALTNAVKHSQASSIEIKCEHVDNHNVKFSVIDNGVGISYTPHKELHYGLSTMKERAQLLNGQLKIHPNKDHGTTVSLTFIPQILNG